MKRFVWRLQRVLDIRKKEVQKKTAELFELTDRLALARGKLRILQKRLEEIIQGIINENVGNRLCKQEFFLAYSYTSDKQLKILKERIKSLESQQKEKIMEVLKVRKSTEGLER